MDDLRIPKISVEIVCHTISNEALSGQIFLDVTSSSGYTLPQVEEFFNSPHSFFPFRIEQKHSILFHKQSLLRVDLPGLLRDYELEVSSLLDFKREAAVYFTNSTVLKGQFIIELPSDHARSLDLLNTGHRFVPFRMEDTLTLLHIAHIYKVEEG